MRGGFATGNATASGPLRRYEMERAERLGLKSSRQAVFASYLTDDGLAELTQILETGAYEIQVPEDAVLLAFAALVRAGRREAAMDLLDQVWPLAHLLCFSPRPGNVGTGSQDRLYRRTVEEVTSSLLAAGSSEQVEKQHEALAVWLPLTDRFIEFWLEHRDDDALSPPAAAQAQNLLQQYNTAASTHRRCGKYRDPRENLPILVAATAAAAAGEPRGQWGSRVNHVLQCLIAKRGAPSGGEPNRLRRHQESAHRQPLHRDLRRLVAGRLSSYPQQQGLEDPDAVLAPVTELEAVKHGLRAGASIPDAARAKVRAALLAPLDVLLERGVIGSGEVLAEVIPQLTATQVSEAFPDQVVGKLMGATYLAFRRRRSLLLVNLSRQVQFEELPWAQALLSDSDPSRTAEGSSALGRGLAAAYLTNFPGTPIPNKLVRELTTLLRAGGLDLPFTEELAADIFTGAFSTDYVSAAIGAARMMQGTAYERYYQLDFAALLRIVGGAGNGWCLSPAAGNWFGEFCAAQVSDDAHPVIHNGRVIEHQQLLTTHNLALLIGPGGVQSQASWAALAESATQQAAELLKSAATQESPHRMVKKAAYAWRQAVFFLSLVDRNHQLPLVDVLSELPAVTSSPMAKVVRDFRPVVETPDGSPCAPPFLGWGPHDGLASLWTRSEAVTS